MLPSLAFDLCERLLTSRFSCNLLNAWVIFNVYWKRPGNEKPSLLSQSNFYPVFLLPAYDKLPWIVLLWYYFLFGLFGCGAVFYFYNNFLLI